MTETTTQAHQATEAATTQGIPLHPSEVVMSLIVSLLAPMFLALSGGDINCARMAAFETLNAYQVRSNADLIAIAQIIAYGLAALGSLSLSMADDISLSMTLRLRSNANACTRSAELNRRVVEKARLYNQPPGTPETRPESAADRYEAEVMVNLAETQKRVADAQIHLQPAKPVIEPIAFSTPSPIAAPADPVLTLEDRQLQAAWASAMTDVAAEFTANLADLSPAEREEAWHRAALLSGCANELLSGTVPRRPGPGALDPIIRLITA
jgi:hypothetical protein